MTGLCICVTEREGVRESACSSQSFISWRVERKLQHKEKHKIKKNKVLRSVSQLRLFSHHRLFLQPKELSCRYFTLLLPLSVEIFPFLSPAAEDDFLSVKTEKIYKRQNCASEGSVVH